MRIAPGNNSVSTVPRSWGGIGVVVALLLATHWGLAVLSIRHKSTTFDEIAHLTRGYSYLRTGDFRLGPPHPPLAHYWAALPAVVSDSVFPEVQDDPDWWAANVWKVGRKFFYESGNDVQAMLFRGRAMIALLSTALGLLVWVWSRRLFGETGGLLSLTLYTFSPTMLAHGRLITTDAAVSLFFLLAVTTIWWVLHRITPASILLGAVAVAGLLLSKSSGVLILPMGGVLVLVRLLSKRPTVLGGLRQWEVHGRLRQGALWLATAAIQSVLVVLLVWTVYGFRYAAMRNAVPGRDRFHTPLPLPAEAEPWDYVLSTLDGKGFVIAWVRDHKLLPESYLYGIASTLRYAEIRSAFLNGENRHFGWWYFFPYCLLVKTPLPFFGVLLVAMMTVVAGWRRKEGSTSTGSRWKAIGDGVYRTAPLWALFAVYWAFAIASNLNIGHRHILPTYPVLFILAGCATTWNRPFGTVRGWIVLGLTVFFVAASLRMFPNYLAYFNSLAGGPGNGHKHLVDSSLDWGQDLPGLKRWLDNYQRQCNARGRSPAPPVYLSYFGAGHPPYYGIEAECLPSYLSWESVHWAPLTGGVYCISATTFQQIGLLSECRWTPSLEAAYQNLRHRMSDRHARPAGHGNLLPEAPMTPGDLRFLNTLRFARLCAHLRQREPDDHIGYSILVFRLNGDDVRRAVDGASPALFLDTAENVRRLGDRCATMQSFASATHFYLHLLAPGFGSVDATIIDRAAFLAGVLLGRGHIAEGVALYRSALRHDPEHLEMNNNLAWFLATTQIDGLRDGVEAQRLATIAAAATGGWDPSTLDTLAAAQAEAGRFDEAVETARRAVELALSIRQQQLAQEIHARLELYRQKTPYREP